MDYAPCDWFVNSLIALFGFFKYKVCCLAFINSTIHHEPLFSNTTMHVEIKDKLYTQN